MVPAAEDVSVYRRIAGFGSGLRAAEGGKNFALHKINSAGICELSASTGTWTGTEGLAEAFRKM